jgi:hypothetical protein
MRARGPDVDESDIWWMVWVCVRCQDKGRTVISWVRTDVAKDN